MSLFTYMHITMSDSSRPAQQHSNAAGAQARKHTRGGREGGNRWTSQYISS